MITILVRRFDELLKQAKVVEATKHLESELYGSPREQVDRTALLNWRVKAQSLLISTCGEESVQVREFVEAQAGTFSTSVSILQRMVAVFSAAKEDYEGGYLASTKSLVQAQVFATELEQAKELQRANFVRAAAVIAGVILETTLRELCDRNKIYQGTLARMNDDLAKAGVYNELRKKQITAQSAMRNMAAHGEELTFNAADVSAMIADIERFLAEKL